MSSPAESHFIPDSLSAMQRSIDQLIEIVDRYDLRADGDLVHALESLRKRTATHQLTLAAFSDSRESKASLIEALLNTTLAKASIPPSTTACTYLSYGLRAECTVTLANSMTAWLPLEQLAEFVSERVPASHLKKVSVRFPNPALENGLVVIDTPELTDDPEALVSRTTAAVSEADACIFVLQAGRELKENVIAFLGRMQPNLEKFFFVVESASGLSGIEEERSLELLRRSLEQRCGLLKPRVALLSSLSGPGGDGNLPQERSEACQAKLLGFARMSWESLTSNEVARVAEKTLTQADGALNLREMAPLQRARLRRAVKALDGISRQSAGLALASDAAMRALVEPPANPSYPSFEAAPAVADKPALPAAPAPGAGNGFAAVAPEPPPVPWPPIWEPTFTTHVSAPTAATATFSVAGWVAPPSATPSPAQALRGERSFSDTTVAMEPEPELPGETGSGADPIPAVPHRAVPRVGRPDPRAPIPMEEPARKQSPPPRSRDREPVFPRRPAAAPHPAPLGTWLSAGRDDEEFSSGEESSMVWRVVGVLAVLAVAWALFVVLRPRMGGVMARFASVARLAAPAQPSESPSVPSTPSTQSVPAPAAQPAAAPPAPDQSAAAVPPPLPRPAPAVSAPVPKNLPAVLAQPPDTEQQGAAIAGNPPSDAALETAIDKWVEASRKGNVSAQVACYAPVVGTYFNSRDVTQAQVRAGQERMSEATAGVRNFHITTIGISDMSDGRRAVLVQKDWDTPSGVGTGFPGSEIEKLVFAQVQGQWKIVGEQEVKLPKLHRTRAFR